VVHLALVFQVSLVAHEDDDGVAASFSPDVVHPLAHVLEGSPVGDVIDDDGAGAVPDVTGDEAAEALLAVSPMIRGTLNGW
jgi:hypothetical protein